MNKKALIFLVFLIFVFSNCECRVGQIGPAAPFTSFRDIPGVTIEEINAIELLLKQAPWHGREYFIYGMMPSTEAFYNVDGEVRGFAALFCEWLTELFGIPFILRQFTFDELLEGLEDFSIDFSGQLMPSPAYMETFFMTGPIAQHTVKYFRLTDSVPFSEIRKTRLSRFALLEDTVTTRNVFYYALDEFEPVFVSEYLTAYELLKTGAVDAIVGAGNLEAGFAAFTDIVTSEFLPVIFTPVSFAAKNPQLEPFVSVMQKALDNGANRHLSELYRQGYREYLQHKLFA